MAGRFVWSSTSDWTGRRRTCVTADAYRPALLVMVGVLALGCVPNLLVRDVDRRHFDESVAGEAGTLQEVSA